MKSLILSLFFIGTLQPLFAGNETGNGGDAVVDEFVQICENLVSKTLPDFISNNKNLPFHRADFDNLCVSTEIISVNEELYLNGIPKDAVNNSESNIIKIQRHRWLSLPWTLKYRLTLHELLGFIGVDDSKYQWTKKILGKKDFIFSPEVYTNPNDAQELAAWKEAFIEKLRNIRILGINQSTYEQEAQALYSAIEYVLQAEVETWKQKHLMVLHGAIVDMKLFEQKPQMKAVLLRKSVVFAIEDLESNSGMSRLEDIIKATLKLSVQAHSKEEELALLLRGSYMGIKALEESDKNYADHRRSILIEIHDIYKNESIETKIKLNGIRNLYNELI